jgi:hypothetical protein
MDARLQSLDIRVPFASWSPEHDAHLHTNCAVSSGLTDQYKIVVAGLSHAYSKNFLPAGFMYCCHPNHQDHRLHLVPGETPAKHLVQHIGQINKKRSEAKFKPFALQICFAHSSAPIVFVIHSEQDCQCSVNNLAI